MINCATLRSLYRDSTSLVSLVAYDIMMLIYQLLEIPLPGEVCTGPTKERVLSMDKLSLCRPHVFLGRDDSLWIYDALHATISVISKELVWLRTEFSWQKDPCDWSQEVAPTMTYMARHNSGLEVYSCKYKVYICSYFARSITNLSYMMAACPDRYPVAITHKGHIAVANIALRCLDIFDETGCEISSVPVVWGWSTTASDGWQVRYTGLCFRPDNSFAVACADQRRIGMFSADGKLISEILFQWYTNDRLHYFQPAQLCFDAAGRLLVSDNVSRIVLLDASLNEPVIYYHNPKSRYLCFCINSKGHVIVLYQQKKRPLSLAVLEPVPC